MELATKIENPVITTNFYEVKTDLETRLEAYKGLVVTEDTLSGAKNAQKELASLRVEIDNRRKEVKKSYNKPLEEFENKCKELIALVEATEQPIKEGIKTFDDMRREEKRNIALAIIEAKAKEFELDDKRKAKLTVVDKYLNLTASRKDVEDDVSARAVALVAEMNAERERYDVIMSVLESANQRLNAKLSIDGFKWDIENGVQTGIIIQKINRLADSVYASEHAPVASEDKTPVETKTEPATATEEPLNEVTELYQATLKLTGTKSELIAVSNYLRTNAINYTVLDQHRI